MKKTQPPLTSSLPAVKKVRMNAESRRAHTADSGRRWCMHVHSHMYVHVQVCHKKGRKQKTSIRLHKS